MERFTLKNNYSLPCLTGLSDNGNFSRALVKSYPDFHSVADQICIDKFGGMKYGELYVFDEIFKN